MARSHRPLAALVASLVLVLAACGVSGGASSSDGAGSDGSTTGSSTDEAQPLTAAEQEMLDVLVETYTSIGFTEAEAECLGRGLIESGAADAAEMPDQTALMDLINGCDISIGRMTEIAGEMGADTFEGGARVGLVASLEAQGLDTDQAECVADAYLDDVGGANPQDLEVDPDAIAQYFEQCDVGPEDFGN
ncbi:MAG: hypothetical protein KDA98_02070 [Acidimicrobiales bacterium]|nr:hypothetical protein [Acidimicrobiales bacterium]